MKRMIALKLKTTSQQREALLKTQELFADGCTELAKLAAKNRCWNRHQLHQITYYSLREQFPELGSQMVCNAIRKVCGGYKALQIKKGEEVPTISFRKSASVHYCARTFSLNRDEKWVTLFTLQGRIKCSFQLGERQLQYLTENEVREGELIRKGADWYFHLVLELPAPLQIVGGRLMSVDLGENNLATTSHGTIFGGGELRHKRDEFLDRRRKLQSNGTPSAKRRLREISGRESRHVREVNHIVSKAIVAEAINDGVSYIVMEELTHIRDRIRGGKRIRARLHRWAWAELQEFVEYKAQAMGIQVIYVKPAYSSLTCSNCGSFGTRRKHRFTCSNCGSWQHSDRNACRNLCRFAESVVSATAPVNGPMVAA
jgi:putative transposase